MGEILEYVTFQKYCSQAKNLCQMTIECNDIQFDVCINKADLLGEPEVGRRFQGIDLAAGTARFLSKNTAWERKIIKIFSRSRQGTKNSVGFVLD